MAEGYSAWEAFLKTHIVLHHSATADGLRFDWGGIRKYHTSYRIDGNIVTKPEFDARKLSGNGWNFEEPWRDIGYHFGIEEINGQLEILLGRMPEEDGAHCREASMNQAGIGICLVGNFDIQVPSVGLLGKTAALCKWLMERYGIPAKNVWGHREAQAAGGVLPEKRKTCPGKLFDMDRFRTML